MKINLKEISNEMQKDKKEIERLQSFIKIKESQKNENEGLLRVGVATNESETDNKFFMLSENLIQKQNQIDTLLIEKNELKYQIDRLKKKNEELLHQSDFAIRTLDLNFDDEESGELKNEKLIPISSLCSSFSTKNSFLSRTILAPFNFYDNQVKRIGPTLRESPTLRVILLAYFCYVNLIFLKHIFIL